jgi:hypothetical protein
MRPRGLISDGLLGRVNVTLFATSREKSVARDGDSHHVSEEATALGLLAG